MRLGYLILIPLFSVSMLLNAQGTAVEEDLQRAAKWNRFVDALYEVHQKRIASVETYTEEEDGGYGGVTNDLEFYHEVRHYDSKTGKLLSNIKWENRNPDNIHVIELFFYDNQDRIEREYVAAYLPVHRKAPFQTLINIHHHDDGLHGYRQFDASDNQLFEFCSGSYSDEQVHIALEDYEIPDSISQIKGEHQREIYRACFGKLPRTAHPFTNPLKEISRVSPAHQAG